MRVTLSICLALLSVLFAAATTLADEPDRSFSVGFRVQSLFQNDETSGNDASFEIKRARAIFDGSFDRRLTGHATIETIDDSGVVLLQGYAGYHFHRAVAVRAGQMYVPFGLESRRGFDRRKFYDRSYVTDGITRDMGRRAEDGRNGRFRDIGVELHGSVPVNQGLDLSYQLMVFNGNGILVSDNNESKDLVSRVVLTLPGNLSFGGSAGTGTYTATIDSEQVDLDETAFGFELLWEGPIFGRHARCQAEYLRGCWQYPERDREPWGYYVSGAVYLRPELEAAARWDSYETDNDAGDRWTRLSLALRFYLDDRHLVAADYEIRDHDSSDIGNRLTLQFTASF